MKFSLIYPVLLILALQSCKTPDLVLSKPLNEAPAESYVKRHKGSLKKMELSFLNYHSSRLQPGWPVSRNSDYLESLAGNPYKWSFTEYDSLCREITVCFTSFLNQEEMEQVKRHFRTEGVNEYAMTGTMYRPDGSSFDFLLLSTGAMINEDNGHPTGLMRDHDGLLFEIRPTRQIGQDEGLVRIYNNAFQVFKEGRAVAALNTAYSGKVWMYRHMNDEYSHLTASLLTAMMFKSIIQEDVQFNFSPDVERPIDQLHNILSRLPGQ